MEASGDGQGVGEIEQLRKIKDGESDVFEPARNDVLGGRIADDKNAGADALIA